MEDNLIKSLSLKGVALVSFKFSKITAVLVLAVLLTAGCSGVKNPSIYAVVDGVEITRDEFDKYVNFLMFDPDYELTEETRLQVLEEMIEVQIYYAEAIAQGYEPDIEAATEDYHAYRDEVILDQPFVGNATGYYARMQELNLSEEWIINTFARFQVVYDMIDDEQEKVEAPDAEEIEEFYEREKEKYFAYDEARQIRHILINEGNFPDATEEEISALSKELAQEIYQRLLEGEDFGELALEYSQDSSAENGGDIGFVEKVDVVKEFGDVAFAAEVGEVAEPVESKFGWHVLEVTEIREAGVQELDETTRAMIAGALHDEAMKKSVDELLAELRDEADIVNNLK